MTACKTEKGVTDCNSYPSIDYNGSPLYVQPVNSEGFTSDFDWQGAIDHCYNLDIDGCDDWYLPSYEELYVLYQNKATLGDFSDTFGSNSTYWSATPSAVSTYEAYKVRFYTGDGGYTDKTDVNRCRCVRR